jgi:hypothetical protein
VGEIGVVDVGLEKKKSKTVSKVDDLHKRKKLRQLQLKMDYADVGTWREKSFLVLNWGKAFALSLSFAFFCFLLLSLLSLSFFFLLSFFLSFFLSFSFLLTYFFFLSFSQ